MAKSVYIVLLNWKQWKVSLVCLESVLRQNYPHYSIVLCDNNSPDNSVQKIMDWAEGRLVVENDSPPEILHLSSPPVPKPIPYKYFLRQELVTDKSDLHTSARPLIIINTGGNNGCANGFNFGIRYAMSQPDCDYVWILNNDTVIDPLALSHLVNTMEPDPAIGIAGSTVCYFDNPGIIQGRGGCTFNYWLGVGCPVDYRKPMNANHTNVPGDFRMDYVMGASMLISKKFIEEVGPMPELTFLYFEELSWACEAKGRFRFAYAPRSIVYHREGSATELTAKALNYGNFADFMLIRNRMVFTKHYKPLMLPTVILAVLGVLIESIYLRRWKRVKMFFSFNFWNFNHYR